MPLLQTNSGSLTDASKVNQQRLVWVHTETRVYKQYDPLSSPCIALGASAPPSLRADASAHGRRKQALVGFVFTENSVWFCLEEAAYVPSVGTHRTVLDLFNAV